MRRVVAAGVFDTLHYGHIRLLEYAKSLGTHLLVLLNTDESVRQLKGKDRPVNCLARRMAVMSALRCVDRVASFQSATPIGFLSGYQPDVYIKGGDYRLDQLPEAATILGYGGQVCIYPIVPGAGNH